MCAKRDSSQGVPPSWARDNVTQVTSVISSWLLVFEGGKELVQTHSSGSKGREVRVFPANGSQIVRDMENRHPGVPVQFAEKSQNLCLRNHIQRARSFVRQQCRTMQHRQAISTRSACPTLICEGYFFKKSSSEGRLTLSSAERIAVS